MFFHSNSIETEAKTLDSKVSNFELSIKKCGDFFIAEIKNVAGQTVEVKTIYFDQLPTILSQIIASTIGLNAQINEASKYGKILPQVNSEIKLTQIPDIKLSPVRKPYDYCPDCDYNNEYEYDYCPCCGTYLWD